MATIDGNETVLLADDEDVVLNIGTLMLRKLGYKVLEARNGKQAKAVYRDNQEAISLVILDMNLPDENVTDICKELKKINPSLNVLHSSGIGGSKEFDQMECGCVQCLSKPFWLVELSAKGRDLLEIHARS